MSNNDLISRKALKKAITLNRNIDRNAVCDVLDVIDNAPTVDGYTFKQVKELFDLNVQMTDEIENLKRPQGEWLWLCDAPNAKYKWSCNKCGRGVKEQENYCPKCGAKMKNLKRR